MRFRLPHGLCCSDAELLRQFILREYDAVPFLYIAANSHRHILEFGVVQAFHGGIESVKVAAQYCTVHSILHCSEYSISTARRSQCRLEHTVTIKGNIRCGAKKKRPLPAEKVIRRP